MKTIAALILILALGVGGCTENSRARMYGGTMTIEIPAGKKFVHATWKEGDLWYATRLRRADEKPETVTLQEQSSLGVMEGTVIFVEK